MKSLMISLLLLPLILQSSSSWSASVSPNGVGLIQQTCNHTDYYNLCIRSLQSDPRSSSADVKGLALISLELVMAKANGTLTYILKLFNNVMDPLLYRYYGTCIQVYHTAVTSHVPEAIGALSSNHYAESKNDAEAAATDAQTCEEQFTLTPLPRKCPFTNRNKAVHDLSLVASGILDQLG